jgi:hypothetical protein
VVSALPRSRAESVLAKYRKQQSARWLQQRAATEDLRQGLALGAASVPVFELEKMSGKPMVIQMAALSATL